VGLRNGALGSIFRLSPLIVVANLANYAFQIGSGRLLGPDAFGTLSGILSIMTVIAVGTSGLQTQVALNTTLLEQSSSLRKFDHLTRQATTLGVFLALVILIFTPLFSNLWGMDTLSLVAIGLYSPAAVWTLIAQGLYHGRSQFRKLYLFSTVQSVSKIAVLFAAVIFGFGISFLIIGLVVTTGVFAFISLISRGNPGGSTDNLYKTSTGHFTLSSLFFWALLYLDLIVAGQIIGTDAGNYTALAVLTKAVIWAPAILGQILFPRLVKENTEAGHEYKTVRKGLVGVVVISSCSTVFFAVFGTQFVKMLYGSSFEPEYKVVIALGISAIPWSIAQFLLAVNFAQERHGQSLLLGMLLALSVLGFSMSSSAIQLALLELATAVGVCCILLLVNTRSRSQHDE
jgi:O-antigen/teichoic acid export membrane protein